MLRLQRAAIAWCVVNVLLLTWVQVAPGPKPPVFLFALFAGVWVFGAVMLWRFPRFGAVGTTLYGVLMGAQLIAMHGAGPRNLLLAGASLATALLAALVFVQLRRGKASVVV